MRICLVYDCLFPHTVGGAERWYRGLSEGLAAAGHEVTYLTMRQWDEAAALSAPAGVSVVAVAPRMKLYVGGRRRIAPPLVFGAGVLWHLLRRGRYDVVHTASFPYFSLLAAAVVRPFRRYRLVVDWHEIWTRSYWAEYLGRAGYLGWLVQRLCIGRRQHAFCPSRMHARRLRDEGFSGEVDVLGTYTGTTELQDSNASSDPLVVFAGRHIPEKRVPALVEAMAKVRDADARFRCLIFGDGPERPRVLELIDELGLAGVVEAPGFVSSEEVRDALARATCQVLPSSREGYGLVVVEAAAFGTPSVVVEGHDNAAVELVDDGQNGYVAPSASADNLAEAILRIQKAGEPMREATRQWFTERVRQLSVENAVRRVTAAYAESTSS